jgi:DNA polymerase-3 subunit epsilon
MTIKKIYVVDTETTGLDGYPDDVIIEIAICKVDIEKKNVKNVYSSLVGHDVHSWAHWQKNAWIFGNSNLSLSMIASAKAEARIAKEVRVILKDKYVTSFNLGYDFAQFLFFPPWLLDEVIKETCNCIMIAATPVCGIDGYYGEYKWPRLDEAYSMLCNGNPANIDDQTHRALDDTLMASHVLLSLIESNAYSLPLEEKK